MALIDFDKHMVMGCIPIREMPEAPKDQQKCEKHSCPICNELMWVSEFKRHWVKQSECRRLYCFICVIKEQVAQGHTRDDIDVVDATRMQ